MHQRGWEDAQPSATQQRLAAELMARQVESIGSFPTGRAHLARFSPSPWHMRHASQAEACTYIVCAASSCGS